MAGSDGSKWVWLLHLASANDTALVRQKTISLSCLSETSTIWENLHMFTLVRLRQPKGAASRCRADLLIGTSKRSAMTEFQPYPNRVVNVFNL